MCCYVCSVQQQYIACADMCVVYSNNKQVRKSVKTLETCKNCLKTKRKQDCPHLDHNQLDALYHLKSHTPIVLVVKSWSACGTTKTRQILVCMNLNGNRYLWLRSAWVRSCFHSLLSGQSYLASIFLSFLIIKKFVPFLCISVSISVFFSSYNLSRISSFITISYILEDSKCFKAHQ